MSSLGVVFRRCNLRQVSFSPRGFLVRVMLLTLGCPRPQDFLGLDPIAAWLVPPYPRLADTHVRGDSIGRWDLLSTDR